MQRDQENSGWEDFNFSIDHMIAIHNKKYNHEFDPIVCKECCYKMSNPSLNPVSSESSLIRDEHIVLEIKKNWDQGKSLFVIYGSGHAIVQEPALRKLLV